MHAAWIGILCGILAGAVQGSFFHRESWLGGYGSWPRRMTRLGHIAFIGLGLVNLGYALTLRVWNLPDPSPWPSRLFVLAGFTMPLVCYLAAYHKPFRHLFPLPVLALLGATILLLAGGLGP